MQTMGVGRDGSTRASPPQPPGHAIGEARGVEECGEKDSLPRPNTGANAPSITPRKPKDQQTPNPGPLCT